LFRLYQNGSGREPTGSRRAEGRTSAPFNMP
jgi:hypothetical protein